MTAIEDPCVLVETPPDFNPPVRSPIMPLKFTTAQLQLLKQLEYAYQTGDASMQAFKLTTLVLQFSPNSYKAFIVRRRALFAKADGLMLTSELEFSRGVLAKNCKNYQQWFHYRSVIVFILNGKQSFSFEAEFAQIDHLLSVDYKNFHLWEFRVWLVKEFLQRAGEDQARHFLEGYLSYSAVLLQQDVLNNSFWAYRAFIAAEAAVSLADEFALYKQWICRAPNSEPGWNFLSGLFIKAGDELRSQIIQFALEFCTGDAVVRGPALFFCCDVSWFRPEVRPELRDNCLLASQFDLPHKNYWAWVAANLDYFGQEQ